MTKFFKNKTKKEAKTENPVPRANDVVLNEYNTFKARAGELQYHIYALEKELARINQGMESLNYESAARQELDKQLEAAKTKETVNESVRQ